MVTRKELLKKSVAPKVREPTGSDIEFEQKFGRAFKDITASEFIKAREKELSKRATAAGLQAPTKEMEREIAKGFQLPPERALSQEEIAAGQVERQEAILKREAGDEITTEELAPEGLAPVTAQAQITPENKNILDELLAAYDWIDSMGGFIDKEAMKDVKMGTLPLTPSGGVGFIKSGKVALETSKVATGIRTTKLWNGVLKTLKTNWKKMAKWTTIGYALWSERSIGNIDSALSQVRESITLPVSLAATNPNEILNAFDMLTDLENDVREYESDVKTKEIFSPTFKLTGRTRPIYQRIKKLDTALLLARQQIAKTEAMGVVLTDEATSLAIENINNVLNQMEKPSKFLGII